MSPADPKTKPLFMDFELQLVVPPDDMLRQRRDAVEAAIAENAQWLDKQRSEVARLEERDRLLPPPSPTSTPPSAASTSNRSGNKPANGGAQGDDMQRTVGSIRRGTDDAALIGDFH